MTEKELKNLRRADLLEMLVESEKLREEAAAKHAAVEEELRNQIAALTEQLNSRTINISESGSLAEACLRVNNVFADTQQAADQYMENVLSRYEHLAEECRQRIAESQDTALRLLDETETKCRMLEKKTNEICQQMLKEALAKKQTTEQEINNMKKNAGISDSLFSSDIPFSLD